MDNLRRISTLVACEAVAQLRLMWQIHSAYLHSYVPRSNDWTKKLIMWQDVMCATSLGGSFNLVTSKDLTLKKSLGLALKLSSLRSQVPLLKYLPYVTEYMLSDMNNVVEMIITRRRSETVDVPRDLLQLILDANKEDPVFFTEKRIREEIKLMMCVKFRNSSVTSRGFSSDWGTVLQEQIQRA